MDNHKLLKEIGASLETLAGQINTALAAPVPKSVAPCNEPCGHSECDYNPEGLCTFWRVCGALHVPEPELLQGYTLAQWDEIRKGGYLCQFAPDDHFHPGQTRTDTMDSVIPSVRDEPFYSQNSGAWSHCRPAQIPGVLRPWFSGDCPVDKGALVVVKWSDGDTELSRAVNFDWAHDEAENITAYMEV